MSTRLLARCGADWHGPRIIGAEWLGAARTDIMRHNRVCLWPCGHGLATYVGIPLGAKAYVIQGPWPRGHGVGQGLVRQG